MEATGVARYEHVRLTMHIEHARPCYPVEIAPDALGPDWKALNAHVFRVGLEYVAVVRIRPELKDREE